MSCSVTKLEHILLSNPPNREVVVTGKAAFWNKTNLVTKPEATTFLAKQICILTNKTLLHLGVRSHMLPFPAPKTKTSPKPAKSQTYYIIREVQTCIIS